MAPSCSICQERYGDNGAQVAALKCGHCFHDRCVRRWFSTQPLQKTCPSCRKAVHLPGDIFPNLFLNFHIGLDDSLFEALPRAAESGSGGEAASAAAAAEARRLQLELAGTKVELGNCQRSLVVAQGRINAERLRADNQQAQRNAQKAAKDRVTADRDAILGQLNTIKAEFRTANAKAQKATKAEEDVRRLKGKLQLLGSLNSAQKLEKTQLLAAADSRDDLADLVVLTRARLAKANKEKDALSRAAVHRPAMPRFRPTSASTPRASLAPSPVSSPNARPRRKAPRLSTATASARLSFAPNANNPDAPGPSNDNIAVASPQLGALPGSRTAAWVAATGFSRHTIASAKSGAGRRVARRTTIAPFDQPELPPIQETITLE